MPYLEDFLPEDRRVALNAARREAAQIAAEPKTLARTTDWSPRTPPGRKVGVGPHTPHAQGGRSADRLLDAAYVADPERKDRHGPRPLVFEGFERTTPNPRGTMDPIRLDHLPTAVQRAARDLLARLAAAAHYTQLDHGDYEVPGRAQGTVALVPQHRWRIMCRTADAVPVQHRHLAIGGLVPIEAITWQDYKKRRNGYARTSPDLPREKKPVRAPSSEPAAEPQEPKKLTHAEFEARPDLLSIREIADAAGASRTTVGEALDRGELTEGPRYSERGGYGRSVVYDEKVEAFIQRHAGSPRFEPPPGTILLDDLALATDRSDSYYRQRLNAGHLTEGPRTPKRGGGIPARTVVLDERLRTLLAVTGRDPAAVPGLLEALGDAGASPATPEIATTEIARPAAPLAPSAPASTNGSVSDHGRAGELLVQAARQEAAAATFDEAVKENQAEFLLLKARIEAAEGQRDELRAQAATARAEAFRLLGVPQPT